MKSKKRIICVVGDLGGTNELLLVAPFLEKEGAAIAWIADPSGRGQDALKRRGVPFQSRGPDFVTDHAASAIVIGTSGSAENTYQGMWTLFGQQCEIPVFWIEDFWGTGEVSSMGRWSPNYMFVIDDIAAHIARHARPDLEIFAFGKPSFQELSELAKTKSTIRDAIRSRLKIHPSKILITFWSSGESVDRVSTHLDALARGVSGAVFVAPRFHPKFSEDSAKELWAKSQQCLGSALVDARDIDPQVHLSIASDIVVADWGCTEGVRAMLLGIPTVVTLFPDDDKSVRKGLGYVDGKPPICQSGAALRLDDLDEYTDFFFQEALDPQLHAGRMKQCDSWHQDMVRPDAAERIAGQIIWSSWS